MRMNPRDPIHNQVIHGIVSYGASRMKMEAKADREARVLAAQFQQAEEATEPVTEPKGIVERLKETRLKASDNVDDSGMIVPILLLGCAIFLLMK